MLILDIKITNLKIVYVENKKLASIKIAWFHIYNYSAPVTEDKH